MERVRKGFTLIELLVVVAIIAILAAIAIPQYAKYRRKAFNAAAESDLRNLKTAMEAAYADTEEYPTINNCTAGPVNEISDNVTTGVSKGVTVCIDSGGQHYSAASEHVSGDVIYTTSDNTTINTKTGHVGKTVANANGTAEK